MPICPESLRLSSSSGGTSREFDLDVIRVYQSRKDHLYLCILRISFIPKRARYSQPQSSRTLTPNGLPSMVSYLGLKP